MSLIIAQKITKRFGDITVLEDISLQIGAGQHIGLIGPNGAGKSTLLNIMTGNDEATQGTVQVVGSTRIGYLTQESQLNSERTLYDELRHTFTDLINIETEMNQLEPQLSSGDDALIQRYDDLQHRFDIGGGYQYESRILSVMDGLRFNREDSQQPVSHLSGGQAARAALAKLLLEEPDLLLLDEPTNHLDVQSVEWLEDYLGRWSKAFVISSHDRHLLDRLVSRIWAINHSELRTYAGNYSEYVPQRELELKHQWEAFYKQQTLIDKSEDFIARNIYDKKTTTRAQSTRKMLEKLDIVDRPPKERKMAFDIDYPRESGKRVLRLQDVTVGYPGVDDQPDTTLCQIEHAIMDRGERVAFIGPNGSGKTTLLKTLVGQHQLLIGETEWGHGVDAAYFAQTAWDFFDRNTTLVDALIAEEGWTISQARNFLGQFLFSGDDVFKKLGQLSGGERSRVALARLSQLGGNFLLLDEPTNHLDIPARETLEEVLLDYPGTILFVSHDRYFVQKLATQIWEIEDGQLKLYKGDYAFYQRKKLDLPQANDGSKISLKSSTSDKKKQTPGKLKKLRERELAKLDRREAELASQLQLMDAKVSELETALEQASYNQNMEEIQTLTLDYEQAQTEQESLMTAWEATADELEMLKNAPLPKA
jgi:ATP-binding cassette subfamily F protein 3